MLKINFEYRKGIFFIRLSGNLNEKNYCKKINILNKLMNDIKFKYIVFNIDNLSSIDIYGINYIIGYDALVKENNGELFLCEKNKNIVSGIFKNKIKSIENELEIFNLKEIDEY